MRRSSFVWLYNNDHNTYDNTLPNKFLFCNPARECKQFAQRWGINNIYGASKNKRLTKQEYKLSKKKNTQKINEACISNKYYKCYFDIFIWIKKIIEMHLGSY